MRNSCESPIEAMFMKAVIDHYGDEISWLLADAPKIGDLMPPKTRPPRHPYIVAAPQVAVDRHRVDFLFVAENFDDGPHICVAVECDGHEFHEKTKEQAARDKTRDRELAAAGVTVLRFAGSEIWRDAVACAEQVVEIVTGKQDQTVDLLYFREYGVHP